MPTPVTVDSCAYRRHGRPNSLSQFIQILFGVRLGFRLCQFNIGRHDDGHVRGFAVRRRLICSSLLRSYSAWHGWCISIIIAAKDALSHIIKFTPTGLTPQSLCYQQIMRVTPVKIPAAIIRVRARIFVPQIGCVIVAFGDKTRKKKDVQISHVV